MLDRVIDYLLLCARITAVTVVSLLALLFLLFVAFGFGFLINHLIQYFGW